MGGANDDLNQFGGIISDYFNEDNYDHAYFVEIKPSLSKNKQIYLEDIKEDIAYEDEYE